MNRETVQLRRRGQWRAKVTAKRRVKRGTRKTWAIRGKEREPRCRHCGLALRLQSHHMYARGVSGGAKVDEDWNHITLCPACHDFTHENRIWAQRLGLLAHVGDCSALPGDRGGER